MDKKTVIQHLISFLEEELAEIASGDESRRAEIESLLVMYRFLPARTYSADEPIIPSSLVSLKIRDTLAYSFIAPRGGGFITTINGVPLQVLTPQSPLGEALLGKKSGDEVLVEVRGQTRNYLIVSSG